MWQIVSGEAVTGDLRRTDDATNADRSAIAARSPQGVRNETTTMTDTASYWQTSMDAWCGRGRLRGRRNRQRERERERERAPGTPNTALVNPPPTHTYTDTQLPATSSKAAAARYSD